MEVSDSSTHAQDTNGRADTVEHMEGHTDKLDNNIWSGFIHTLIIT